MGPPCRYIGKAESRKIAIPLGGLGRGEMNYRISAGDQEVTEGNGLCFVYDEIGKLRSGQCECSPLVIGSGFDASKLPQNLETGQQSGGSHPVNVSLLAATGACTRGSASDLNELDAWFFGHLVKKKSQ